MSNDHNINDLPKDSLQTNAPQDQVDWATIAIAVPREFKKRFEDAAKRMGLRPSQYGRTVLIEALGRMDRVATPAQPAA